MTTDLAINNASNPAIVPQPDAMKTLNDQIKSLEKDLDKLDLSVSDSKNIVPEDERPKGKLTRLWLHYAGKDIKYYNEDSAKLAQRGGIGLFATVMMGSAAISAITAPPVASAVAKSLSVPPGTGLTMAATFLGTLALAHGAFKFIDTTIVDGVREKKIASEIIKEVSATGQNIASADGLAKKLETAALGTAHLGKSAVSSISGDTILKLRLGLIAGFAFLSTWKFLTEIAEGAQITENLRMAHNKMFGDSNTAVLNSYEQEYLARKAARVAAEDNLTRLTDIKNGVVGNVELNGPLAAQKAALLGDISGLESELSKAKDRAERFRTLFSKEVTGEKFTIEIDGTPYTTSGKESQAVSNGYTGPQNKLYKGMLQEAESKVRSIEGQIIAKRGSINDLYDQARQTETAALASRKDGAVAKLGTAQEDIEIARKKELAYKNYEDLAMQDTKYKAFNPYEGRDSEMIRILMQDYGPIDYLKTAAIAGFAGTLEMSAVIHAVTAKLNDGERNELRHNDEKALVSAQAAAIRLQIAELESQKAKILNDRATKAAELARLEVENEATAQRLALENAALGEQNTLITAQVPLAQENTRLLKQQEEAEKARRKAEESLWALEDAQRGEDHARKQLLAAQNTIFQTIMGRVESAKIEDMSPEQRAAVNAEVSKLLDLATATAKTSANDNKGTPAGQTADENQLKLTL